MCNSFFPLPPIYLIGIGVGVALNVGSGCGCLPSRMHMHVVLCSTTCLHSLSRGTSICCLAPHAANQLVIAGVSVPLLEGYNRTNTQNGVSLPPGVRPHCLSIYWGTIVPPHLGAVRYVSKLELELLFRANI